MMALEEKFEIQLDEEGEFSSNTCKYSNKKFTQGRAFVRWHNPCSLMAEYWVFGVGIQPVVSVLVREYVLIAFPGGIADMRHCFVHAGAEKISTVQEAADMIANQVRRRRF